MYTIVFIKCKIKSEVKPSNKGGALHFDGSIHQNGQFCGQNPLFDAHIHQNGHFHGQKPQNDARIHENSQFYGYDSFKSSSIHENGQFYGYDTILTTKRSGQKDINPKSQLKDFRGSSLL